ncbi:hypothetical protein [Arthrobacter antibioticus]|uniref:hypothetical protein n=1 Tax=Arthrobacter sp. H35-MC1 TaxID=3046203 RepID=UPI0024B97783|nr:hypothetical protein [Arthrobacter sp. H35-MC1]
METVATERIKYTSVPISKLKEAIAQDPRLATELAKKLEQITTETYDQVTITTIREALDAAGLIAVKKANQNLDVREKSLKIREDRLEARERALKSREQHRPATTQHAPGSSFSRPQ